MTHYVYEYSDDPAAEAASARVCDCGDIGNHTEDK